MKSLAVLEKKVLMLLSVVGELKDTNEQLREDNKMLRGEAEEQRKENAKLIEDNVQLMAKLDALESSMLDEKSQIKELSKEKASTVQFVDDLIESIDSLLCEKQ